MKYNSHGSEGLVVKFSLDMVNYSSNVSYRNESGRFIMNEDKGRFVLTLSLKTDIYQKDLLEKNFRIVERFYNLVLDDRKKQYFEMTKRKDYRSAMMEIHDLALKLNKEADEIKKLKKQQKECWAVINEIKKQFNWSDYGFKKVALILRKKHNFNINSAICQSVASRCWVAFEKYENELFKDMFREENKKVNPKVHFKRRDSLLSVTAGRNSTGIIIKEIKNSEPMKYMLKWGKKLSWTIDSSNFNTFEWESFRHDIAYCVIKRKKIKGNWHYYVQVIFKGNVPIHLNQLTGKEKHKLGKGKVGLYFQADTLTIATEKVSKIIDLTIDKSKDEQRMEELSRLMSNSRKAMNPGNYNGDGTIKKGYLNWVVSNRYKKYRAELNEIYRKQQERKKLMQEIIVNEILEMGNEFICNDMSFKFLQQKMGTKIQSASPAMLKETLSRKLSYRGIEISNIPYKLLNEELEKKGVEKSERYKVAEILRDFS